MLGSDTVIHMLQCANIGPADYNYDETISTLRYANRAKNIKNKARINEDPKDAMLRQFQKEIEELKKKLEEGETLLPPCVALCTMLVLFEWEHSLLLCYLNMYHMRLAAGACQCSGFVCPAGCQERCLRLLVGVQLSH